VLDQVIALHITIKPQITPSSCRKTENILANRVATIQECLSFDGSRPLPWAKAERTASAWDTRRSDGYFLVREIEPWCLQLNRCEIILGCVSFMQSRVQSPTFQS
jgi:hypothetical protein